MIYTKIRGFHRSWVREVEDLMRAGKESAPIEKAYSMTLNMWKAGLPDHITSTVSYKDGWFACTPSIFYKGLLDESLKILDECGLDHDYTRVITDFWLELTKAKAKDVDANFTKEVPSAEELILIVKNALDLEAEEARKQAEKSKIRERVYQLAEKAGINLHSMYMSYEAAPYATYYAEKSAYEKYVTNLINSYNPETDTLDLSSL